MPKYNDLDMKKWKEYSDIYTDTLWIIDKRDNSDMHSGHYHGNFIPQIPNQMLRKYTKKKEWVLDPFMGSGTTLIEAKRLKRNSIGIEIQEQVAKEVSMKLIENKSNEVGGRICIGDSRKIDISKVLDSLCIDNVQFIIYHPPYWDIIKFSNDENDISNSKTLDSFLKNFEKVINNTIKYLEKDRYCALVIGDKYSNGELIPLSFYCMNLFLKKNLKLKATIVKNFEDTKGKLNQKSLWRYRALASDYYIFKHEYIMVFKKVSK